MKLISPSLEMRVIKTLTHPSMFRETAKAFALLNSDCFYTKTANECYSRLRTHMKLENSRLSWGELCVDPEISQGSRKKLIEFKDKPLKPESIEKAVNILQKFRQMRSLLELSNTIQSQLDQDKVDIKKLIELSQKKLAKTTVSVDVDKWFIHIGAKDKSDIKAVRNLLKPDPKAFIPTGLKVFDEQNHGIPRGSLFLLAGPTGSGKSLLAGQLALNMAKVGASVCVVPMEMKNEEMLQRTLSNISKVEMQKIIYPKSLTDIEKKRLIIRYKKLRRSVQKMDAKFSMLSPDVDLTAEETALILSPYDFDVEIYDYVSLFKGVDGDDQWREMRNVTRFFKRHALINSKVVILCAQLSAEGLVRYSRGMVEDASNAFFMQPNDKTSETGFMMIDQPKARNQKKFKFPLFFDYEHMLVRDLSDSEKRNLDNASKKEITKQKKGKQDDDVEIFE